MNETYIISFVAGSSGRFVASIVWNLINDLNIELKFGKYNSAHNEAYWSLTWDMSRCTGNLGMNDKIYEQFDFNLTQTPSYLNPYNKGILTVHIYPKFDIIEKRFPETKIIMIQVDEEDLVCLATNCMYKNGFEIMESIDDRPLVKPYNYDALFARTVFFEKYNRQYDVLKDGPLSIDDKNEILSKYFNVAIPIIKKQKSNFIDPIVPESFKHKTLIVPYKDLFKKENNKYVGLKLLETFTNTKSLPNTVTTYEKYALGRKI